MEDLEYIFVQLEDYWDEIDGKRHLGIYTMFECQKIAAACIPLIKPLSKYIRYDKKVKESTEYFENAIKRSERYHDMNTNDDSSNIMNVLRDTKVGIDIMLAKV